MRSIKFLAPTVSSHSAWGSGPSRAGGGWATPPLGGSAWRVGAVTPPPRARDPEAVAHQQARTHARMADRDSISDVR